MLKKIGFSFIVIALFGIIVIKSVCKYNQILDKIEINNIFINGKANKTNYIGYIQIDSINLKKGIRKGINDQILNENDVGMIRDNNIILAGHGVENVFGNLFDVKMLDNIQLYLYDKTYNYIIYKKIIVEKDDTKYLNEDLVLITCTNDDKRLLVLAKKNDRF